MNPDCAADKHKACAGDAWDDRTDTLTWCACVCHRLTHPIRALTVRQPWAWAIAYGGKDVENRTRNVAGSYRGLVAIHAGLEDAVLSDEQAATLWQHAKGWPSAQLSIEPHGAIVCVSELVDVCVSTWQQMDADQASCCLSPWAQMPPDEEGVIHHLHLRNPRPLAEPVPARGLLSLWRLSDDLDAAVRAQLAAVA